MATKQDVRSKKTESVPGVSDNITFSDLEIDLIGRYAAGELTAAEVVQMALAGTHYRS
ncbi:MAG: hypothetical protein SOS98_02320 [Varibaculum sp.]|nr:hypothetical protein [Varibaculum sp.]